jgi:hypothetical protein
MQILLPAKAVSPELRQYKSLYMRARWRTNRCLLLKMPRG